MHRYFHKKMIGMLGISVMILKGAASVDAAPEYVDLNFGMQGEAVTDIQKRLTELGYYKIPVDGDYGNGTQSAVSLFQRIHDLPDTGITDETTWTVIFSEEAVVLPERPMAEVTAVSFGETTSVTIKNNLDKVVDSLTLGMITYDEMGEVYYPNWVINEELTGLGGMYFIKDENLEAFESKTYELDLRDIQDSKIKNVGCYIRGFHTADGYDYEYDSEQIAVIKSDKTKVDALKPTNPDVMSDEMIQTAEEITLGITSADIMPWISDFYHDSEGALVTAISETEILRDTGIRTGDVITAFDDTSVLLGHAWEYAKLELLKGDTVTVHYTRYNKEYTSQIHTR